VKAGVYVRISRAKDGTTLGVDRQEPPCRDLCARKGWTVHEPIYCDNDLSAYSGKKRPQYQRLLQDARDGVINAIVAWDADRLTRLPVENEQLIELCERYGIALATVTGEYDLATSGGRMHFRIKGAVARHESEHRAERVRLKHEELRAAGKYWGGQRGFGHRVVPVIIGDRVTRRIELDEDEAELIRAAARRVLRGGSISAIVKEWATSGIRRPKGRLWETNRLRELLISPRIAGLRQNGDELVEADWPAIVDRDTWEQLRAILGDAPTAKGPKEPRSYLLSNIAICDRCGTPMLGQARMGTPAYACRREKGGCGRVHRIAKPLDDYLRDEVLDALASPEFRAKLEAIYGAVGDDVAAELVAKREGAFGRLKQLRSLAGDPTVEFDADDFAAAKRSLDRIIGEVTAKLADLPASNALADLPDTPELLRELWERSTLDRRRALVRLAVDEVILKAPGGGAKFRPNAFPPGEERDRHVAEHLVILWRA
jgi:DNA invertase Pin-like site-specific DNA recombinase